MTASGPVSAFVDIDGLRLHYLDWGGPGIRSSCCTDLAAMPTPGTALLQP
jgi:hypothetical protein